MREGAFYFCVGGFAIRPEPSRSVLTLDTTWLRDRKKAGGCASDFPYPSLTVVRSPTSPQTFKSLTGERLGAICLPTLWFCTISTISPAFFRSPSVILQATRK